MKKVTFIGWVNDQARVRAMAEHWGLDLFFVKRRVNAKPLRFLDYLLRVPETIGLLRRHTASDEIWLQCPPTIPGLLYLLLSIPRSRGKLVLDFHNSMLRGKWLHSPFASTLIKKADVVLAHNHVVQSKVHKLLPAANVLVLEDKPFEVEFKDQGDSYLKNPYLVFPCSFDPDEPIESVLEAASLFPNLRIFITGGKGTAFMKGKHCPQNIEFTGYLPVEKYWELLEGSAAIIALTDRDDVQLSVANEAASLGLPMILTGSRLLRDLYPVGCSYAEDNSAASICSAISDYLSRATELRLQARNLKEFRSSRWHQQALIVERALRGLS